MKTKFTKSKNPYMNFAVPTDKDKASEDQVRNSAGGYVYQVDKLDLLKRMLIFGTKYGTYYLQSKDMTREFAELVRACAKEDAVNLTDYTLKIIRDTYLRGMYLDEQSVIFALATFCSTQYASHIRGLEMIPELRTGTALLTFCAMIDMQRGWGRAVRSAVAKWYNREPSIVAYQILKYRERNGWSHRDVLRKAHVVPSTPVHQILFSYITYGWGKDWRYDLETETGKYVFTGRVGNTNPSRLNEKDIFTNCELSMDSDFLEQIAAYERVKDSNDIQYVSGQVKDHRMTIEMVPNEKRAPEVWESLSFNMPIASLIRNLNKLSETGLFFSNSEAADMIYKKLEDITLLRKARIHPIDLYLAWSAYDAGTNRNMNWKSDARVSDCLRKSTNAMLNVPVESVELYHRVLIAIDHSGSMGYAMTSGMTVFDLACFTATYLKNKFNYGDVITFSCDQIVNPLSFDSDHFKNFALAHASRSGSGTSCSDVLLYAQNQYYQWRIKYDAIIILTDSETWASQYNIETAVKQYRASVNSQMRFINIAMVANSYTLAKPLSLNDMEFTGFDTNMLDIIEDFIVSE